MGTINVTLLRKDLFNTLDNVVKYNEPVIVNTKKGNAVIISEEEYKSMQETIYLISQPGLLERIKEGEKEDLSTMRDYDPNEDYDDVED